MGHGWLGLWVVMDGWDVLWVLVVVELWVLVGSWYGLWVSEMDCGGDSVVGCSGWLAIFFLSFSFPMGGYKWSGVGIKPLWWWFWWFSSWVIEFRFKRFLRLVCQWFFYLIICCSWQLRSNCRPSASDNEEVWDNPLNF